MPNASLSKFLHLHLIVFIWGFTAILGELITITAIPLVWYRMGLATFFMLLYLLLTRKNLRINKSQAVQYCFGGIIIAVHWITFFYAIKISNVSVALATMSTGAFFSLLIEAVLKKRKVNLIELLLGILAIIGLVIIYSTSLALQWGIAIALLSAFLSALFSVINADFVKKNTASVISFYEILFGVLAISIYLFVDGSFFEPSFFSLELSDWLWLVILSSICTAYAFIASVDLLKFLTPFTVMLTINLEPIYAIVLAFFILNETMPSQFYIGALLILLTVFVNGLLQVQSRKKLTKLRE